MTRIDFFEMYVSEAVLCTAHRSVSFDAVITREKSAHFCRYSCASYNVK